MQQKFGHGVRGTNWQRKVIYYPQKRPGFTAWTTAFDYGNGSIGLSFKETLACKPQDFVPPTLEMGHAVGAPVSYCSVECGCEEQESFRVYMISHDNGATFTETGRCQLEQGSFCNVGFSDGRILGFDVPRINENRTGWCDYIEVRESTDGGTTWQKTVRLLEGCAPYLWRARRLKNGTILLLASLYGTPWGPGKERSTRNTMLPGESYLHKIQTFFLTTKDGRSFTGPHYVLPGVGAHEYDVVECADGALLFIAGDVQATPVARQLVYPTANGEFINGTMYGIHRGAPPSAQQDPQGGFVPESMAMLPNGTIIGSRRNKPYACSNDLGENWYEVDDLPPSLYQPFLMTLPNGTVANFGHFGGDISFGQADMYIGADFFSVDDTLPRSCKLQLEQMLSEDASHYENRFRAQLLANGKPAAGQTLTFRFAYVWNKDGSVANTPQEKAPLQIQAVTDTNGYAFAAPAEYNQNADIHFAYNADVVFTPSADSALRGCEGPMMCVLALSPYRRCRYPYPAYLAEGTLYLSPDLLSAFPNILQSLQPLCGQSDAFVPQNTLPEAFADILCAQYVLLRYENGYRWAHSIHAPCPLHQVLPMSEGDWYV